MQARQSSIQQLMQTGAVWKGAYKNDWQQRSARSLPVSTGLKELDAYLSGGWEWGRMHEIQCPHWFMGEVHLLQHAFKLAAQEKAPVFWVNPPGTPYAHTLSRLAGASGQHIQVQPEQQRDALWAAEAILDSGCARVLCLWADALSQTDSRKLHLAIQEKNTLGFVFTRTLSSEARSFATRLRLPQAHLNEPCMLLKRSGGWPVMLSRWPYLRH